MTNILSTLKVKGVTANNKRKAKLGDKNPNWGGDNVSIEAFHQWLRCNWPEPIPTKCQTLECNKAPYDLANITGIYDRDFSNYRFLCRKCHMESDGRMKNIDRRGKISWNKGITGYTTSRKGMHHSSETKKKMSESAKKRDISDRFREIKTGRFASEEKLRHHRH